MKHPRRRVLFVLIGTLALSLVGTASYASFRTAMGPEQCCKSRCHHRLPIDAARRCCLTHPSVTPAAIGKGPSAKEASAPAHVTCQMLPSLTLPARASSHVVPVVEGRAPPGSSLLARHTSLLL